MVMNFEFYSEMKATGEFIKGGTWSDFYLKESFEELCAEQTVDSKSKNTEDGFGNYYCY